MIIGGLQKFSLLDYPGYLSAIIFTQGCNFRCQYCYNPMLVWPASAEASAYVPLSGTLVDESVGKPNRAKIMVGKPVQTLRALDKGSSKSKYAAVKTSEQQKGHPILKEDDLFAFLKSRAGKLDAVVVTGGEPTLQKDLVEFLNKIKKLGYLIKLDTNGANPDKLAILIKKKLLDYIAMDLKAPRQKYKLITRRAGDFNKIAKSVKIILASGLPYEFRTTVVPGLLDSDDIKEIGKTIKGAKIWYLQNFKGGRELVNKKLIGRKPYSRKQMEELAEIGRNYVKKCEVR